MSLTLKQTIWRPTGKKTEAPPAAARTTIATPPSSPPPPSSTSATQEQPRQPVTVDTAIAVPTTSPAPPPSPPPPPPPQRDEDTDGLTEEEQLLLRRLRQVLPPLDSATSSSDADANTENNDNDDNDDNDDNEDDLPANRALSTSPCATAPRQHDTADPDAHASLSLLIVANVTYRENCLRRCLWQWHTRRARHEAQQHRRTYFADQYHHRTLLYVLFRAWQWRLHARQKRRGVARQAEGRHGQFVQRCAWREWRAWTQARRAARARASELADHHTQQLRRRTWVSWAATVRRRSLARALARVQSELLCEARFDVWRAWTQRRQRLHLLLTAAQPLLCAQPTALLFDLPLRCATDSSSDKDRGVAAEELRWRQTQARRSTWIQWLKWTCQRRATRLHVHEQNVATLHDSTQQWRRVRAWRTWLVFTASARMQRTAAQHVASRWFRRWCTVGVARQCATQQYTARNATRPLRLCFDRWLQRRATRQAAATQETAAEHFYVVRHLLHSAWRAWRHRLRVSTLDRVTEAGRQQLLQYIALHRLTDHSATAATVPPAPPIAAEAHDTLAETQQAHLHHVAPPAESPASWLTATQRPPIPLDRTRLRHSAPPPSHLAPAPPPPPMPRPAEVLWHPSQPYHTSWSSEPPVQGPPPWVFTSHGWYPTVPTTSTGHASLAAYAGPPSQAPPGWPGALFPPLAPPSTVTSAPTEAVVASADSERRHADMKRRTHGQQHRPHRIVQRTHPKRRVSSSSSASSSCASTSFSSEPREAPRPRKARSRRPPLSTEATFPLNTPTPWKSLVPSIPTLAPPRTTQPQQYPHSFSTSTSLADHPPTREARYHEGKQLLLAYKARKAVADGEAAELAAVEAELRLYDQTQRENLSLHSDAFSTSAASASNAAPVDRVRHLQERFVQLHQRRLQREQLKAQLRQFVSLHRSDGQENTSLASLLDGSFSAP